MAEYLLGMLRTRAMEMADTPESRRTHAALVDLFMNGARGSPAPRSSPAKGKKATSKKI